MDDLTSLTLTCEKQILILVLLIIEVVLLNSKVKLNSIFSVWPSILIVFFIVAFPFPFELKLKLIISTSTLKVILSSANVKSKTSLIYFVVKL